MTKKPKAVFVKSSVLMGICGALITVLFLGCGTNPARTITVRGEGRIKVAPDQVEMTVKVEFTEPRLNDAVVKTKDVMEDSLTLCREYSIGSDDIKTSRVMSGKAYAYNNGKQVFLGYRSTQTTNIVIKNIDQFEQFTANLMKLKITEIERISFLRSDIEHYKSEADLLAVDDANQAADRIVSRISAKKGKIIYVNNTEDNVNYSNFDSRAQTLRKELSYSGILLSPGMIEVVKHVVIMYEID